MRNGPAHVLIGACLLLAALSGCEPTRNRRRAVVEPKPTEFSEPASKTDGTKREPKPVPKTATTPRKAYEMFRRAIADRDFDTCWRLMSRMTQDSYERTAREIEMRAFNSTTMLDKDRDLLRILGLTSSEAGKLTGKMA